MLVIVSIRLASPVMLTVIHFSLRFLLLYAYHSLLSCQNHVLYAIVILATRDLTTLPCFSK